MTERENAAFVWMLRTINKLNVRNRELQNENGELKKRVEALTEIARKWEGEIEYMRKMDRYI